MSPKSADLKKKLSATVAALAVSATTAHADTAPAASGWNQFVEQSLPASDTQTPVVQNREVSRAGRLQLFGPLIGRSDRQDFHTTWVLTLAGRYHFNEESAWEFLRVDYARSSQTELASEIQALTSFHPDVQLSTWQLGTAYVYTPIYGKYAWSGSSLVHFDIFGRVGAGIRYANDRQPFAELGVGMSHYAWSQRMALVPELRWRFYSENRSTKVWVTEGLLQLGISWLF